MSKANWEAVTHREGACIKMNKDFCDRVISIEKLGDEVVFQEMCDEYFSITVSKEEAVKLLQEAIDFINK